MIYTYNKLVRDKIVENIKNSGRNPSYRIIDNEEYLKELNKKLLEEAHEFVEENSIEELADVFEVIESIIKIKNINIEEVRKYQQIKKEKNGGFDKKIYLINVEQDNIDEKEEKELKKDWRNRL